MRDSHDLVGCDGTARYWRPPVAPDSIVQVAFEPQMTGNAQNARMRFATRIADSPSGVRGFESQISLTKSSRAVYSLGSSASSG
jgi:hypothetical protein